MKDRDFAIEQIKSIIVICIVSSVCLYMLFIKYFGKNSIEKEIFVCFIISCLGIAGCISIIIITLTFCLSIFDKNNNQSQESVLLNVIENGKVTDVHVLNSCIVSNNDFNNFINLRTVIFKNPKTQIKAEAFWGLDQLKFVELPDDLKIMEKKLFINCTSLKSLKIPKRVKYIKEHCFFNCNSLMELIFLGSNKIWMKIKDQKWKDDLHAGCIVKENKKEWILNCHKKFELKGEKDEM